MTLGEYLRAAARTPWQTRVHDCSAWPARWAGVAHRMPPYETDEEAEAIVAAAGGLVAMWERCIDDALARVDAPQAGDIGIIEAVGRDGTPSHVGAIYTGRRWAVVTPRGLAAVSVDAVAIWRAPCPS